MEEDEHLTFESFEKAQKLSIPKKEFATIQDIENLKIYIDEKFEELEEWIKDNSLLFLD